jgi:hypothetical protein
VRTQWSRQKRLDAHVRDANLLEGFRQGKHAAARSNCTAHRGFTPFHETENDRDFRFREHGQARLLRSSSDHKNWRTILEAHALQAHKTFAARSLIDE